MGKLVKFLAALFGLLILAVVIVVLAFDPNRYKPEITAQVEKATGRTLLIAGDIGLQLFPSIGFSVDDVSLSNAQGFSARPMVEVAAVDLAVKLMPLFSGQLIIDDVSLRGVSVRLESQRGKTNLDDLSKGKAAAPEVEKTTGANAAGLLPEGFYLGSITLEQLELASVDLDTQQTQLMHIDRCSLGPVAAGQVGSLACQFKASMPDLVADVGISGELSLAQDQTSAAVRKLRVTIAASGKALPKGAMNVELQADANYGLADKLISLNPLTLVLDGQSVDGHLSVQAQSVTLIRFELASKLIDIDALLPSNKPQAAQEPTGVPASKPVEPDLRSLKDIDLAGTINIAQLKAANVELQDVLVTLKIAQGTLSVAPVLAKLYDGDLMVSTMINGGKYPASYEVSAQAREVEALPLIKALAGKELITGKGSVGFRFDGVGLTPDAIKKAAKGRGNFEFKDGAVNGINVPYMIRSTYARLTGKTEQGKDVPQQTDFTALTGSFNLADGKLTNSDLLMMSPLLRLSGKGAANLLDETTDYRLLVALVASLEGQGGKSTDELKDLEIPLHISGPMVKPDISLDLESAMASKAKGDLKQKLDEKLKENDKLKSLKDKLGDFL